jgi:type I restriction enzyme S subunit
MAMYGQGVTRGRVAILGIDAAINQACAAIHESKAVSTKFLYYFLEYNYRKIRSLGHGANQTNLNAALIKSILVSLTSLSVQEEISRILNACDKNIAILERETELLNELFRAVLGQLVTGQLSTVPLIEESKEASP